MEVTRLALAFAFLILLVWGSKTLNQYSEDNYGYIPISFSTIVLSMIPYALLIAGFVFFKEDPGNQMMAVILGIAAVLGLFWWLEQHSSFFVALGAITILLIAGILMFVVIMLASGGSDDDDYYYD